MSKKGGFGKLLAGVAIGAGLGILFAPKSGKETRAELKEKIADLIEKAKKIDKDEVKKTIEEKIEVIQTELSDLDKEKVLKIAKKKAQDIQKMASDLVNYAVEKGTPVLESAAEEVRKQAIKVTKEILNKLEKDEK